jgi:hypothetical protein
VPPGNEEDEMPRVLVVADDADNEVIMSEHVVPDHLRSEHGRVQLVERLAWSVDDAVQVERGFSGPARRPRERSRSYLEVGD